MVLEYFITCPQIPLAILSFAGLSNTKTAGFMWLLGLYDVPCSCFYSYCFYCTGHTYPEKLDARSILHPNILLHWKNYKRKTSECDMIYCVQDDKLNSGFGPSPLDRPNLTVTIQHMVHIFQSISNKFNIKTEGSWNSGASKNEINYSINNSKLHFKKFYSPMIWTCNHLHMGPQY